jgi:hypothetical protein
MGIFTRPLHDLNTTPVLSYKKKTLTDDEVRTFLLQWLLEFGMAKVTWKERRGEGWYKRARVEFGGLDNICVRSFFLMNTAVGVVQLKSEAIEFIQGDNHGDD